MQLLFLYINKTKREVFYEKDYYYFTMTLMMFGTLFAQSFTVLPDNFTEEYSSLEEYQKAQEEQLEQMLKS